MGKKSAKVEARRLAAFAAQIPEEMAERRRQQEQAYLTLRGELGKKGTYETEGAASTGEGVEVADIYQKASIGRLGNLAYGGGGQDVGQTINPSAIVNEIKKSTEFRIASRLTAESEQMLKREGPLWDEMQKSVQGPIIEGSSAFLQEQAEGMRREFAKGGAARNRARQGMQEFRMKEKIAATKQQQLWNSSLALNQWSRDNARTQLNFNQQWASNAGGIRESFHQALDNAGKVMLSTLPYVTSQVGYARDLSAAIHSENRAKSMRVYKIAASVAMMVAGGAGAAGMLGSGAIGGALAGSAGVNVAMQGAGMLGRSILPEQDFGAAGQQAVSGFGKPLGNLLFPSGGN